MEDNVEKLRKIGVKEIAKQTKISTSRIQDILDKQFEHTQRVHLVGFLQILEREYKLDLSSVLKAYDDFHNTHPVAEEAAEKIVQIQDLSLDTQKQRYDAIDERKKQANSKQKFYITLVSVVIVIFIYLIYQNIASKYASNENPPSTQNTQETQKTEQETGADTTTDATKDEAQNSSANEENTEQTPPATQNTDKEKATDEIDSTTNQIDKTEGKESAKDKDNKPESSATTQNTQSETAQTTQTDSKELASNTMAITTSIALWFDIVDLDTNRRKYQGVTNDTYTIKTDNHRWLLAFGHSNFNLTMNGSVFAFPKSNYPLYFIYEPENGFKKIDPQTYKRLAEQVR